MRSGFATNDALRAHLDGTDNVKELALNGIAAGHGVRSEVKPRQYHHPRWVRVNTIKSTLDEQLRITFAGYKVTESLEELLRSHRSSTEKLIHIDKHVPNLLALPPDTDLSKTKAYISGQLIIQDKASCFPAYLLQPQLDRGDCLDACAAPGNKTTHLAAIIHEGQAAAKPTIYAYERDRARASTLLTLLQTAGAHKSVITKAKQDFLKIDPAEPPGNSIGTLLLDPSCSGSGIVGRDETLNVVLPSKEARDALKVCSKKRKRESVGELIPNVHDSLEEIPIDVDKPLDQLSARLNALSAFQLKLLLHAFRFPSARRITYSTCSIYPEENEYVVTKALGSSIAHQRGWQILRREDQVSGMKAWKIRGKIDACTNISMNEGSSKEEIADACIRCEKGTEEGTQGFFVVGFVRQLASPRPEQPIDQEWEGFSDSSSHS